jgi:hypothetical protein
LNEADRSIIGNPRERTYAVSFIVYDVNEALELSKLLTSLGLQARISCKYGASGPETLYVNVRDVSDQKRLFELIESRLEDSRRERLNNLVLARGPVPPWPSRADRARLRAGTHRRRHCGETESAPHRRWHGRCSLDGYQSPRSTRWNAVEDDEDRPVGESTRRAASVDPGCP